MALPDDSGIIAFSPSIVSTSREIRSPAAISCDFRDELNDSHCVVLAILTGSLAITIYIFFCVWE